MSKNNLYDVISKCDEETKNDKITTEELINLFCQLSENDKQTVRNFISSIKSSSNPEQA